MVEGDNSDHFGTNRRTLRESSSDTVGPLSFWTRNHNLSGTKLNIETVNTRHTGPLSIHSTFYLNSDLRDPIVTSHTENTPNLLNYIHFVKRTTDRVMSESFITDHNLTLKEDGTSMVTVVIREKEEKEMREREEETYYSSETLLKFIKEKHFFKLLRTEFVH